MMDKVPSQAPSSEETTKHPNIKRLVPARFEGRRLIVFGASYGLLESGDGYPLKNLLNSNTIGFKEIWEQSFVLDYGMGKT